jgi:hypothetical protein
MRTVALLESRISLPLVCQFPAPGAVPLEVVGGGVAGGAVVVVGGGEDVAGGDVEGDVAGGVEAGGDAAAVAPDPVPVLFPSPQPATDNRTIETSNGHNRSLMRRSDTIPTIINTPFRPATSPEGAAGERT